METTKRPRNSFVIKTNFSLPHLPFTSPKLRSQRHFPKIPNNRHESQNFNQLIQLNDDRSKLTLYRRGRSSESSLEGILNKRCQHIFLSLPYQSTNFNKKQYCYRKWRKLILCVQAVLFFFKVSLVEYKIRSSSPPKMTINHSAIHFHPYPESPTNRKRKKEKSGGLQQQVKSLSFGEKIETLINLQKLKVDTNRNNSYLRQFKSSDIRINRLISQKAVSCHSLHSTIDNSKQLPSLTKLDSPEKPSIQSTRTKKFSLKLRKIH